MGKKSFALGRSLADILKDHSAPAASDIQQPNPQSGENNAEKSETVDNSQKVVEINVELIDPNPFQPRKVFSDDELVELAESIEHHGLIQPIAVRKVGDRYQLISGERRTRASKLAGLPTIKAQVYENLDDKAMAEWALIENIQRVDLNPVEVAKSYQQLIDNHGYTHEDLSKIVSKSRSAITNSLRLLKLPEVVLLWIEEGKISGGAARALCSDKIQDPEEVAKRIIEEGLNVRQIEAIARGEDINQTRDERRETREGEPEQSSEDQPEVHKPEVEAKPKVELSADMKQFESRLETFFGTKVQINPSASTETKGSIVINYYSMDDLTRIQELMENR
ncbi:chromosome partitioning protein, ParB family [Fibrobacter sp. UWOV1]|uniref:ParB/RepB/Spo0J family partition protein n=1 Tax=Fibrobacter sp. UWOV1 TaxID=1896215 RepID=UPI0009203318|nr:ParB/RepB/Spo0J family partition protein [Fibrobacter sp. UWOV1]SHL71116.1 chromosome partitioning protein, ParB family [Fibrobacter sp. UWOV1]